MIVPPDVPVEAMYKQVKVAAAPGLIELDVGEHEPDGVTVAVPVGTPSAGLMTS